MKKLESLKKRADFLDIQKKGNKWVSKTMIVQVAPNNDLGQRIGLVVTKKIFKSAVFRNRVKRRLRALLADVLPSKARSNFDYVVVGRLETKDIDFDVLQKDLLWCLKRLDLLNENTA